MKRKQLIVGREGISEKSLRRLAGEYHWERQRERFAQLLSGRAGDRQGLSNRSDGGTTAAPR